MEFIIKLLSYFTLSVLLYGIYSRLDTIVSIVSNDIEWRASQDSNFHDMLNQELQDDDSENKKNMRMFLSVIFGLIVGIGVATYFV